ncbi:MAG: helix-turn-helix domain-containing protein [Alphaproteobacteria bacterium]|nr:helix-turn-helix domain-containing protein [Alphaproteobacteria bacterium]
MGYPVMLHDGVDLIDCLNCDHIAIFIPDMPGLIATVAASRLMMGEKLNGRELQLIRKSTGLKAVDLAQKLDVTPETVSRWENNKEPMRHEAERSLRLKVLNILSTRTHVFREDYEALIALDINPIRPGKWPLMHFHRVKVRDVDKRNVEPQWETALAA